jgi:1-acyl-sn-glycerol-3-phosphate acyltransferase
LITPIARVFVHLLYRLVSRVELTGRENIPASGAFIAVGNHIGRLDAGLVYFLLGRQDVTMLVAEKYRENALARWFVRNLDAVWVDRFNADFAAMRETLERLRRGGVVIMAPEGTRSPTGSLIEGRAGAAYLAARTGLPVLPVGISGTEDRRVLSNLRRLKRAPIAVRVGKTFTLPLLAKKDREAALQKGTDEIMARIAMLLPPSQRGVYAGHPRLLELLRDYSQ